MASYIVTFREPAVVTEVVEALNAKQAIEKVKLGEGDRVGFEIDETVSPTRYTARVDRPQSHGSESGAE